MPYRSVSPYRLFLPDRRLFLLGDLGGLCESFLFLTLTPALALAELLGNRLAQIRRALHCAHPGALQRLELIRRRAFTTRHDRARMTHALARRRSHTRDVGNH